MGMFGKSKAKEGPPPVDQGRGGGAPKAPPISEAGVRALVERELAELAEAHSMTPAANARRGALDLMGLAEGDSGGAAGGLVRSFALQLACADSLALLTANGAPGSASGLELMHEFIGALIEDKRTKRWHSTTDGPTLKLLAYTSTARLLPVVHLGAPAIGHDADARRAYERLRKDAAGTWVKKLSEERRLASKNEEGHLPAAHLHLLQCQIEVGLSSLPDPQATAKYAESAGQIALGVALTLFTGQLNPNLATGLRKLGTQLISSWNTHTARNLYQPLALAAQLTSAVTCSLAVEVKSAQPPIAPALSALYNLQAALLNDSVGVPHDARASSKTRAATLEALTSRLRRWEPAAAYVQAVGELLLNRRLGIVGLPVELARTLALGGPVDPAAPGGARVLGIADLMRLDEGGEADPCEAPTMLMLGLAQRICLPATLDDVDQIEVWLVETIDTLSATALLSASSRGRELRAALEERLERGLADLMRSVDDEAEAFVSSGKAKGLDETGLSRQLAAQRVPRLVAELREVRVERVEPMCAALKTAQTMLAGMRATLDAVWSAFESAQLRAAEALAAKASAGAAVGAAADAALDPEMLRSLQALPPMRAAPEGKRAAADMEALLRRAAGAAHAAGADAEAAVVLQTLLLGLRRLAEDPTIPPPSEWTAEADISAAPAARRAFWTEPQSVHGSVVAAHELVSAWLGWVMGVRDRLEALEERLDGTVSLLPNPNQNWVDAFGVVLRLNCSLDELPAMWDASSSSSGAASISAAMRAIESIAAMPVTALPPRLASGDAVRAAFAGLSRTAAAMSFVERTLAALAGGGADGDASAAAQEKLAGASAPKAVAGAKAAAQGKMDSIKKSVSAAGGAAARAASGAAKAAANRAAEMGNAAAKKVAELTGGGRVTRLVLSPARALDNRRADAVVRELACWYAVRAKLALELAVEHAPAGNVKALEAILAELKAKLREREAAETDPKTTLVLTTLDAQAAAVNRAASSVLGAGREPPPDRKGGGAASSGGGRGTAGKGGGGGGGGGMAGASSSKPSKADGSSAGGKPDKQRAQPAAAAARGGGGGAHARSAASRDDALDAAAADLLSRRLAELEETLRRESEAKIKAIEAQLRAELAMSLSAMPTPPPSPPRPSPPMGPPPVTPPVAWPVQRVRVLMRPSTVAGRREVLARSADKRPPSAIGRHTQAWGRIALNLADSGAWRRPAPPLPARLPRLPGLIQLSGEAQMRAATYLDILGRVEEATEARSAFFAIQHTLEERRLLSRAYRNGCGSLAPRAIVEMVSADDERRVRAEFALRTMQLAATEVATARAKALASMEWYLENAQDSLVSAAAQCALQQLRPLPVEALAELFEAEADSLDLGHLTLVDEDAAAEGGASLGEVWRIGGGFVQHTGHEYVFHWLARWRGIDCARRVSAAREQARRVAVCAEARGASAAELAAAERFEQLCFEFRSRPSTLEAQVPPSAELLERARTATRIDYMACALMPLLEARAALLDAGEGQRRGIWGVADEDGWAKLFTQCTSVLAARQRALVAPFCPDPNTYKPVSAAWVRVAEEEVARAHALLHERARRRTSTHNNRHEYFCVHVDKQRTASSSSSAATTVPTASHTSGSGTPVTSSSSSHREDTAATSLTSD